MHKDKKHLFMLKSLNEQIIRGVKFLREQRVYLYLKYLCNTAGYNLGRSK